MPSPYPQEPMGWPHNSYFRQMFSVWPRGLVADTANHGPENLACTRQHTHNPTVFFTINQLTEWKYCHIWIFLLLTSLCIALSPQVGYSANPKGMGHCRRWWHALWYAWICCRESSCKGGQCLTPHKATRWIFSKSHGNGTLKEVVPCIMVCLDLLWRFQL